MAGPVEGGGPKGTNDHEETPHPLKNEQIEGHVSALKSLIISHNQRNKGNPIRLDFESKDTKEVTDEDLGKPFKEARRTPLTRRIIEFDVETGFIMGVPEVIKISSFMDVVKSHELAKHFLNKVPTKVNEMMERLDDFVRSKEAYVRTELPRGEVGEAHRKTHSNTATFSSSTSHVEPIKVRKHRSILRLSLGKGALHKRLYLAQKTIRDGIRVGQIESLGEGCVAEGKRTSRHGGFPASEGNQCDQCELGERQEAKGERSYGVMDEHPNILPSNILGGRFRGTLDCRSEGGRIFGQKGVGKLMQKCLLVIWGNKGFFDNKEGNTAFDGDTFYLGDEASVKKKEAEVAKRLWEDRQLMTSGAVRETEVQTEFDDEEERRVILLVHDTKPPFLDGRIVKGSNLVREVHEKPSMNKSRQRFLELAGSKLGNILGVEKSAEQIDADTAVVGEDGEVDLKGEAKFQQHLTKGEAVSDFAKSKSLSQQRQYLPIFSIRDELLQVILENHVIVVVGNWFRKDNTIHSVFT
uniref:Pre-mRNA-splicing factor ATP-dependent RNA helicase DEAH7 n=1 Tax=Tanacetum cinerariifolium TaxID=118510 RepID=A0A6L2MPI5_TANCI|nr:pre-mRNA-splicing factor ATP-dependent RNA helicase DEAH7 [Tanacetum cinerariifolium]